VVVVVVVVVVSTQTTAPSTMQVSWWGVLVWTCRSLVVTVQVGSVSRVVPVVHHHPRRRPHHTHDGLLVVERCGD